MKKETKIAIIGASYLQLPLIKKAKELGYITHVFAWAANDVGEKEADFFYPISIVEKDLILDKCQEIGINGICSIASDLAIITVNYVAQNMGLISNDMNCTTNSTNKHLMRKCFESNNDPSPKSVLVEDLSDLKDIKMSYPLIVKPIDRSGSRGITKVYKEEEIIPAIENAKKEGFEKKVLIEEFAEGQEYSVECISWKGRHQLLAVTKKYTTGAPHFIETGHMEPADVSDEVRNEIKKITFHALNSLGIRFGASHTEIKIDEAKNIKIIEIGGRMGGDMIGSDLVQLSTGYDFVKAVINVCLGIEPREVNKEINKNAGVKFVFGKDDVVLFNKIKNRQDIEVIKSDISETINEFVTDSSNRNGYYIFSSDNAKLLDEILNI